MGSSRTSSALRRVKKASVPGLPAGLSPLISRRKIAARIPALAREVTRGIPPKERPIAVVVLQGAFIFAADLVREFPPGYPLDVAFVRCDSYGANTSSSGRVLLLQDLDSSWNLNGRTVLLVDDILDTGLTLSFLSQHFLKRGAARVRTCVLLQRQRPANDGVATAADFAGFEIGSEFVVGYGLDHAGRFRGLADLAALQEPGASSPQSAKKKGKLKTLERV